LLAWLQNPAAAGTAVAVVGIGASASEVFESLWGDLPGDTGFAIVFVQHLDPSHRCVLAEILERATAQGRGRGRKSMVPMKANGL
jgi:chemotaxis response regulator CheB